MSLFSCSSVQCPNKKEMVYLTKKPIRQTILSTDSGRAKNEKNSVKDVLEKLFSTLCHQHMFNYTNVFIYMWNGQFWLYLHVLRAVQMR